MLKVAGHFSKKKLNEKSSAVIQTTAVAAPKKNVLGLDEAMLKWTKGRVRPLFKEIAARFC